MIRVLNSLQGGGSGVANAGSLSLLSESILVSCIPLNSFIFKRTIKGSKGIRLVFQNTALQSTGVKVFVKNLLNSTKKSAFEISFIL